MKKLLFVLLGSLGSLAAFSQSIADKGCGTVTTEAQLDRIAQYVANEDVLREKTTGTVDSIPLTIHIVGDNSGVGYYELDRLFPLICNLNTHFAPAEFYFYIAWPLRYINNSNYYQHDFSAGYQMMQSNNVANTVNVYFVDDPSGNCGYFSPGADGVAIGKNCAAITSTTLTHELGHFFDLPHTFSGWENGNIPSNKEYVTRGVGANCNSAGDRFCDTDADYVGYRWTCPYSDAPLTDPLGVTLHVDSSLYMSYATDACMTRFSGQQMGKMKNDLYSSRTNLLQFNYTSYSALDTPNVIYPTDTLFANNQTIKWNKVNGAQYYRVRVSPKNIPGLIRQQALTADTSLALNFTTVDGSSLLVTITPLNARNVCGAKVRKKDFVVSSALDPTGINTVNTINDALELFPNPSNNQVTIQISDLEKGVYSLQVLNVTGQIIKQQSFTHNKGQAKTTIQTTDLSNGIYTVKLIGNGITAVKKLLVRH